METVIDETTGQENGQKRDRVVGLYSFPKSGNTWLRAIIASIVGIPDEPGALQRYVTDTHYGRVMEDPWRFQGVDWYFYKSHHKRILREHQGDVLRTNFFIYIYRHPLDVFVSYLNFVSGNVTPEAGKRLPVIFDRVEDLTPDQMEELFAIYLEHGTLFPANTVFGSIFESIRNFHAIGQRGRQVLILRYEDLQDNFAAEVERICQFLRIRKADVDAVFAGADSLTRADGKFFWKRQKDNYKNFLTEDQIARFYGKWGEEMTRLGYQA